MAPLPRHPGNPPIRLVIVEDDPAWQVAYTTLLDSVADCLAMADCASSGLAIVQAYQPDAVILDYQLVGEKTGADIAHQLVAQGWSPERLLMISSTPASQIGQVPCQIIAKHQVAQELPRWIQRVGQTLSVAV